MKKKKIVLRLNIRECDREKFVNISSQYVFPIHIVKHNGMVHIDAKSLLGVISIDTINDCKLEITSNKEQQECVSEYINRIKDFTI